MFLRIGIQNLIFRVSEAGQRGNRIRRESAWETVGREVARAFDVCPTSALVADALGQGPRALPGNVHKLRIARDLLEHGQKALRFREQAAV